MNSLRKNKEGEKYLNLLDTILNHYIKHKYSKDTYLPFQFLDLAIVSGNDETSSAVKDYLVKNKEKISEYINDSSAKILKDVCESLDSKDLCSYKEILCD